MLTVTSKSTGWSRSMSMALRDLSQTLGAGWLHCWHRAEGRLWRRWRTVQGAWLRAGGVGNTERLLATRDGQDRDQSYHQCLALPNVYYAVSINRIQSFLCE